MSDKLKLKDYREALYYMLTKEPIPKNDTERIDRAVNIIGLTGLASIVGGILVTCTISMGPRETYRTINEGIYCGLAGPYASHLNLEHIKK